MKSQLRKTLFIVLPLAGLLGITLGACGPHHRRSNYGYGASHGGSYGQAYPYGNSYDEHRGEHDRDRHDGDYHGRGY